MTAAERAAEREAARQAEAVAHVKQEGKAFAEQRKAEKPAGKPIDRGLALRAGAVQTALVVLVSLVLALLLPRSFFEDWGWLTGPAAWFACAAATAYTLHLDVRRTLLGALLAGLPSAIAVILGVHWLGLVIAVIVFALWCGSDWKLPPRRQKAAA